MVKRVWPFLLGLLIVLFCGALIGSVFLLQPHRASFYGVVHMHTNVFNQPTVTIWKGDRLTLVNDDGVPHDIINGSWIKNKPIPAKEAGAPMVDIMSSGKTNVTIGPFSSAGTYHIFCTIHPGMNLTIIVQSKPGGK